MVRATVVACRHVGSRVVRLLLASLRPEPKVRTTLRLPAYHFRLWTLRRIVCRSAALIMVFGFGAFPSASNAEALEILQNKELNLRVIQFTGPIRKDSFKDLEKFIDEAERKNPIRQVFLSLNSPGGLVEEALAAGRLIKNRRVGTVLLPGANCHSACTFLFFAGIENPQQPRRLAFAGSHIGVHSSYLQYKAQAGDGHIKTVNPNEIYSFLQDRIARVMAYLNEMRVPPGVQERVFGTPSKALYYLTEEEKLATDVVRVTLVNGRWTAERSSRVLTLPASLMATTSNSASEMLDDLRLRKFEPTASGTTRITFLPPRPYPRFPHRPRTVSAKWLAGSSSGDRCLRVEGQDPGRNLMLTICRRQGELAGTLEFSGGMMEPWTQLAALTLSNLTGDPEVGVIAAQRQLRLPVSAAATELSRLHFALKELPNGLGSESSLYQLRLDFSPANTQEVLIFVTPEFRSALKHEFSRGSVAGAGH